MKNNKILGNVGENLACEYIESYIGRILKRNYRCRIGEIDIIAIEDMTLVFIEVKTRTSDNYGMPSEAVSSGKQKKIVKTALLYITQNNLFDYMCRFDVLEIIIDMHNNTHKINLIKDAFQYSGKYGY